MAGIGVIVNPHARGNREHAQRMKRFSDLVGTDGEVVATGDIAKLEQALLRFHDCDIDILAVCGGDGSMYRTLTRALALWGEAEMPLLLPLRGGTINNLSRSIGARRRKAESMLSHVVRDYRSGHTHEVVLRELLKVNEHDYGYLVGAGLVVNFLRQYYSTKNPGPLSAFGLLARLFFSNLVGTSLITGVVASFEADVECDGERVPLRSFNMLLASTISHVGLGIKPFYMSSRKRGHFHLLAGCCTAGAMLGKLWRFFRGFPSGLEQMYDNMGARVVVRFASPQAFTINGDILDPVEELRLEGGPKLRFISG